jgi:hypothetical protein
MTYAQYCRIESRAGGLSASPRAMIRTARTLLSPLGKSRTKRDVRHEWLREMFVYQRDALAMARMYRL